MDGGEVYAGEEESLLMHRQSFLSAGARFKDGHWTSRPTCGCLSPCPAVPGGRHQPWQRSPPWLRGEIARLGHVRFAEDGILLTNVRRLLPLHMLAWRFDWAERSSRSKKYGVASAPSRCSPCAKPRQSNCTQSSASGTSAAAAAAACTSTTPFPSSTSSRCEWLSGLVRQPRRPSGTRGRASRSSVFPAALPQLLARPFGALRRRIETLKRGGAAGTRHSEARRAEREGKAYFAVSLPAQKAPGPA